MDTEMQKIVQYLNEAHATELALSRVLESQIAMTPVGSYRDGLEKHLGETQDHADRVERRLGELGAGDNPVQVAIGAAEALISQALSLAKTPLDLVRGGSGEEKVLKNAKDACATEALEIATYTALEQLARSVDDDETAELASSIRQDEQDMLDRVLGEIPNLAAAVVGAEVEGDPSFDITETGAGEAVRKVVRGPDEGDLPIPSYDSLKADEVTSKLTDLSQIDLAKIDVYERENEDRATVLSRIESLRGDEPWPSYDEQSVSEITSALRAAREEKVREVATYERAHKSRTGVLRAARRDTVKS